MNVKNNTRLNMNSDITMPLLFLGHGSPMNAIEENEFVQGFRTIAKHIPTPASILCISAHWQTRGTFVTAMPKPKIIYDFGGFPQELYQVRYPAQGNPQLAQKTSEIVQKTLVKFDDIWGLDHGAWSVIKHLYPKADIPIVQMSLDYTKSSQFHFDLARELLQLRKQGVLIIGSGNIIHNLRMVAWDKLNAPFAYDWAIEANEKIKADIITEDFTSLIQYHKNGKAFELAIPTPEHYLPLLYVLSLKEKDESLVFFNDAPVGGSLSMTSLKIG